MQSHDRARDRQPETEAARIPASVPAEQIRRRAVEPPTSTDSITALANMARQLTAPGKGLLAADESLPTIEKRFKPLGIESTESNRRAYRATLFTAPELGRYISGVILFDETLRQTSDDGTPLATVLSRQGIVPGIKVDLGTVPLANFPEEKITQGLDGLRERLREYYSLGARFTKWRAVLAIGPERPSFTGIAANAECLARFAALSQEAGLVPIVEPEILMDGDHSIERCEEVTNATLPVVFARLLAHRVQLGGMLLKPAMVLPGTKSKVPASDSNIAERTRRALQRHVPAEVAGIVFLSGGQSPAEATRRLGAINRGGKAPWPLTFSFGRALQDDALRAWEGKTENVPKAQAALLEAARQASAAARGGN